MRTTIQHVRPMRKRVKVRSHRNGIRRVEFRTLKRRGYSVTIRDDSTDVPAPVQLGTVFAGILIVAFVAGSVTL